MAHQAGAYPGFGSMKRLGVSNPSREREMLVHRRVTPSIINSPVPIYTPEWRERHRESKMSCPRTLTKQCPGQGSNLDRSLRSRAL